MAIAKAPILTLHIDKVKSGLQPGNFTAPSCNLPAWLLQKVLQWALFAIAMITN